MTIEKLREIFKDSLVKKGITEEAAENGIEEFIKSLSEENLRLLCELESEVELDKIKGKLYEIIKKKLIQDNENESHKDEITEDREVDKGDLDENISEAIENVINDQIETEKDGPEYVVQHDNFDINKLERSVELQETDIDLEILNTVNKTLPDKEKNEENDNEIYAEYTVPEVIPEVKEDKIIYSDKGSGEETEKKRHVKKPKPSIKCLALTALIYACAGIVFLLEIIAIAAFVVVLIAVVGIGVCFSLFGIIYGIVQLFSTTSIGVYEIGFGIIIAGITMLTGVLIYNFDIHFLPYLIRKTKDVLNKYKKLIREKYFESVKEVSAE